MRLQTVMEPAPRVVLKMEVLQILENYIENSFTIFSGPAKLSEAIFMVIVNFQTQFQVYQSFRLSSCQKPFFETTASGKLSENNAGFGR